MYENEVQRGIEWLAKEHPEADLRDIDLDELNMGNFKHCVLGQLFGYNYSLSISNQREGWAAMHGFTLAWDENAIEDGTRPQQWRELASAWGSAIVRARKAAPELRSE